MTDEPRYFVPVPEWIVLAGLTPQALALYTVLLAHVNRERGDGLAWPSMETLADLLGFKHRHSIAQHVRELVALGAVTVGRRPNSTDRGNVYCVLTEPPASYEGLRSITEYYAARKAEDAARSPRAIPVSLGRDTSVAHARGTEMDKNQTKPTRRIDPYESTSGDEVASSDRRTSSPMAIEDQRERPKLPILLGRDFDDLPHGQVPQFLVKASVAAARKIDVELAADAKTELGRAIKSQHEQGVERRELARRVEVTLNLAAAGKTDFAWAFGYPRAA